MIGKRREKHSTAREAIQRQWHLLRELPRFPATVTVGQIARRLAANGMHPTPRTIERDMVALSAMFPIVADESKKPYAWSWAKDAPAFTVPGLTNAQALALNLLQQHLAGLLPESITGQLRPYFAGAEVQLAAAGRHSRLPAWIKKVKVIQPTQTLRPPTIKSDIQNTVYEALLAERQVRLVYHKRGATSPSEYAVHPLGLIQRGPVTYLVCTLFDYPDPMLLALHRIRSALMLDEPSVTPNGFDLEAYVASGAADFGAGKMIRLETAFVRKAAEHLHETPLSKDQAIRSIDAGRVKVTARVADTPQLRWWLLAFGDQVEVLKPKTLRQEMAKTARVMAARYR